MEVKDGIFTSESVTAGHPDKVADQISDAVLDAILAQDPNSRVACETLLAKGVVISPAIITIPFASRVSHATLELGKEL